MGRRADDLTGRTFGHLAACCRADRPGDEASWECRCVCGRTVTVRRSNLLSGNTRSCGCRPSRHDLAGCIIGLLTVIRPARERVSGGRTWECRCACGRTVIVAQRRLLRGAIEDCGCAEMRTRTRTDADED